MNKYIITLIIFIGSVAFILYPMYYFDVVDKERLGASYVIDCCIFFMILVIQLGSSFEKWNEKS